MQRVKGEAKVTSERVRSIEHTVDTSASIAQMQAVLASMSDHKRKLDGVISGTVSISPIESAMQDIHLKMEELHEYLQLPRALGRSLPTQLGEISTLIENLGSRMGEVGLALGKAGMKLEQLETVQAQHEVRLTHLESILTRVETNISEKISSSIQGFRERDLDFTGLHVSSVKQLAQHSQNLSSQVIEVKSSIAAVQVLLQQVKGYTHTPSPNTKTNPNYNSNPKTLTKTLAMTIALTLTLT